MNVGYVYRHSSVYIPGVVFVDLESQFFWNERKGRMRCASIVIGMSVLAFGLPAVPTSIGSNVSSVAESSSSISSASEESIEPVTRHALPVMCSFFPNWYGCEAYRRAK